MAKMTLSGLKSAMQTYVASAKQAAAWSKTTGSFTGLLDKVGKIVTIDGLFGDRLAGYLEGDDLPLGKTVEEYFIDLTLPTTYTNVTTDGALAIVPSLPTVESVLYSYSLGRAYVKTTLPFDNFERAMNTNEDTANCAAKIMERLQNSYDMVKYQVKKQLIGNFSEACYAVATCKQVIAKPVDTATGEAFIKQVKKDIEIASLPNENSLTANALIGSAPSLVLFVHKGIMPSIEVDTEAGAFNVGKLAIPAKIVVVDDFGTTTNAAKIYALLVDERGLKVHNGYNATRSDENGNGDFINYYRHYELTAFYSKYVYGKVYATA